MKDESRKLTQEGDYFELEDFNVQEEIGYAQHGFILALYCLMRSPDKYNVEIYDWAMYQVSKLGGDSDTNCAIVGGVVGAYASVENIDRGKINKVLLCNVQNAVSRTASVRPNFVQPAKGCIDDMLKLMKIAPQESLEIATEYVDSNITID